jgi:hypothetical protein
VAVWDTEAIWSLGEHCQIVKHFAVTLLVKSNYIKAQLEKTNEKKLLFLGEKWGAAFEIIWLPTLKSRKARARKMYIGTNLHESPCGI